MEAMEAGPLQRVSCPEGLSAHVHWRGCGYQLWLFRGERGACMSPTLHSLPRLWSDPTVSLSQICLLLPLLSPLGVPSTCPGVPLLALRSTCPNTSIECSVIDFAPLSRSSPTAMNQNLVWCEIRAFLCPKPFHVSGRTES